MKYSHKEMELLYTLKELELEDVCNLMVEHGYYRTKESLQRKLESMQSIKYSPDVVAWNKLILYRARALYNNARARAKEHKIEFDLTLDWIKDKLAKGICEGTGLILVITEIGRIKKIGKTNPFAPSLDKIDSKQGYTKNNTQLTSLAFNTFKGQMQQHEMLYIAKAIVKHHMLSRQFTVNA